VQPLSRSALRHQRRLSPPAITANPFSVTVEPCRKTNLGFHVTVEPCRKTNLGFSVTVEPCRKTNLGFHVTVEPCRKTNFGFSVTVEPCRKRIACMSRRSNRMPNVSALSGAGCSDNELPIDSQLNTSLPHPDQLSQPLSCPTRVAPSSRRQRVEQTVARLHDRARVRRRVEPSRGRRYVSKAGRPLASCLAMASSVPRPLTEGSRRGRLSQRLLRPAKVGVVRKHQPGQQAPVSGIRPPLRLGGDRSVGVTRAAPGSTGFTR
jgi:hypothetical protein